jgi:hypothetical protein
MKGFFVILHTSLVQFYKQYIRGCVTQVELRHIMNNNISNETETLYNLSQLEDNCGLIYYTMITRNKT